MKSFICCFFMAQADAEAESLMHATGNAKLAKLRTGGISGGTGGGDDSTKDGIIIIFIIFIIIIIIYNNYIILYIIMVTI